MALNWTAQCEEAQRLPTPVLQQRNFGSKLPLIFLYCVCAAASGIVLRRWLRLEASDRSNTWRLFGRFVVLVLASCCAGILSWSSELMANYYLYEATHEADLALHESHQSRGASWEAARLIFNSLEFFSICFTKLLVLDRMVDFVTRRCDEQLRQRLRRAKLCVLTFFTFAAIAGLSSSIGASYYFTRQSFFYSEISAAFKNRADAAYVNQLFGLKNDAVDAAARFQVATFAINTVILLFIVCVFLISGLLCYWKFERSIPAGAPVNAMASLIQLQRQIYATVFVVFSSFLLRSAWAAFMLWINANLNQSPSCFVCEACQPVQVHIWMWLGFTPMVELSVVFFSGPVSLLVALWGMMSGNTRRIMFSKRRGPLLDREAQVKPL